MKRNASKISKSDFYKLGGFSNPRLFRKHDGADWEYFMMWD